MGKILLLLAGIAVILWIARIGRIQRLGPDVIAAAKLLHVSPDASATEINAAHRQMVARAHPDRGGSEDFTRRLNNARDILLKAKS